MEFEKKLSVKKIAFIAIAVVASIVLLSLSGRLLEEVNSDEIVVIQHPISGDLDVYTSAGTYPQYLGRATHYKKRSQYWFSNKKNEGEASDQSVKIRFNDGGHAQISGSVSLELPVDRASVIEFHTKYGSQQAIEHDLVGTVIDKSVYMTGPLMSSKESYAEKRNDLISYIEDQAMHGIYMTTQKDIKAVDALTQAEKVITIVDIVKDSTGFKRQERSPIERYHIKLSNLSINEVVYDGNVEKQINGQQQLAMQVQTAIANAKKAEQDALTVEQQGKANAASAKWEQEVIKAKAVTEAQQQKEVAALNVQTAQFQKQKLILEGEGEAEKKRLAMGANNMLENRLAAYVEVNKAWALAATSSNWVPSTLIGGPGGVGGAGGFNPTALMDMLTVKTAKDLGFDPKPGDKK